MLTMEIRCEHIRLGLTASRRKCKYGKDGPEPDSLTPDATAMLNDINASMVDTDDNLASRADDMIPNLIRAASNDDNEDYDIAAQEEPDEPARDGEAQHPRRVTLYFGSRVSIPLSDLFDFTSQGRNNNRFEHFQQAGKSNLAKEMEIYETVGTQMWQEEINKLGSENSPIEVM